MHHVLYIPVLLLHHALASVYTFCGWPRLLPNEDCWIVRSKCLVFLLKICVSGLLAVWLLKRKDLNQVCTCIFWINARISSMYMYMHHKKLSYMRTLCMVPYLLFLHCLSPTHWFIQDLTHSRCCWARASRQSAFFGAYIVARKLVSFVASRIADILGLETCRICWAERVKNQPRLPWFAKHWLRRGWFDKSWLTAIWSSF